MVACLSLREGENAYIYIQYYNYIFEKGKSTYLKP